MTKNELIARLQSLPGNPLIIHAVDPEGNAFAPIDSLFPAFYCKGGELWLPEEGDTPPVGAEESICLWPGY